jgi:parallel beta-helix repeat protein
VEVTAATPTIRNSTIKGSSIAGIAMTNSGASAQILTNTIDNLAKVGDGISLSASSPNIEGNRITRTNRGLYLAGASNPTVIGNIITDNNWGMYLFGNNSPSNTAVPAPLIQGNDFGGSTNAHLEVNAYPPTNPVVIDARGNWWGTSMPSTGVQVKLTSGTVVTTVDFSEAALTSINYDSQGPGTPAALSATAISATQVQLTWSQVVDDFAVVEYRIERCAGSGCTDFIEVHATASTSWADTGLTASMLYRYRLRAKDSSNNFSDYSAVVDVIAQVDSQAPTPPSALDAGTQSSTQIDLTWAASEDDVGISAYLVERCVGANCTDFAQVASVSTTKWKNTGLSAGTSYRYRVRSRDPVNNLSDFSNIDAATTSAAGADCD